MVLAWRREAPASGARRVVRVHASAPGTAQEAWLEGKDNAITTSHYTLWNFPLLNLFKQMHRAANVYFFLIVLLQTWQQVSITKGSPSLLTPLVIVLVVTAIKDALEDHARHRHDRTENNRPVEVLEACDEKSGPTWVTKRWSRLKPGSIVRLKNRDRVPADVVLLGCSEPNRIVHVMTAGLDGETNLKQRQVLGELPADLSKLGANASVTCDAPNKLLESFDATIVFHNPASGLDQSVPLSIKNVLLRGSQVRNSDWAIGVVVYSGEETKLHMNAATASFKTSSCMAQAQRMMLYIFALQCSLCVGMAVAATVLRTTASESYYLSQEETGAMEQFVLRFFNYMLIFTNFIPISLLVTIDLVKFGQGFFIAWDLEMFYPETGQGAKVNCSELNEELGCIEHIFTDKTGTLTANVMRFKAVSCGGQLSRSDGDTPADPVDDAHEEALVALFHSVAVNHDVLPETGEDGERTFSASSPDEGALVHAALVNGFALESRNQHSVTLKVSRKSVPAAVETVPVLHVLEFSSNRKRSSVIVERPGSDELELHCKGADSVILDRLAAGQRDAETTRKTMEHLNALATEGLRTLCIARRTISRAEYDDWNRRYREASVAVENRKAQLEALQDEIERDLVLIGCTGIEDKLQEHVAETIAALRDAGIRIWMLTGDKVDTAINIGFMCALWTHDMEIVKIVLEELRYDSITEEVAEKALSDAEKQIGDGACAATTAGSSETLGAGKMRCLVMDTNAIFALTKYGHMDRFVRLASQCESVICARVSPDQKAVIVQTVRDSDSAIKTLSIGDGANDVPMIQKAHVGVGLFGQEGMQAANSADFALARFHFLRRLLLVHGRWSARRIGLLICYIFYKNVVLVLPQFLFGFYCIASGQNIYLDYPFYQGYNVFFTAFPIIAFGIFDQDVSATSAAANPSLYSDGSQRPGIGRFFSCRIFARWIAEGSLQAGLVFFACSALVETNGITSAEGYGHGIWYFGTLVHLCVCAVVTTRLLLENKSVNRLCVGAYLLSFALWGLSCLLWSTTTFVPGLLGSSRQALGNAMALADANSWHAVLLTVLVAMLPSYALESLRALFYPSAADIVRESQRVSARNSGSVHPSP